MLTPEQIGILADCIKQSLEQHKSSETFRLTAWEDDLKAQIELRLGISYDAFSHDEDLRMFEGILCYYDQYLIQGKK